MRRALPRLTLTLILIVSLAGLVVSARDLIANPALRPLVERGAEGIRAATDAALARAATPERIAERLRALLAETPRNWVAIEAVEGVAAERDIPIPPDVSAQRARAWDEDSGYLAAAETCLACLADASRCELSAALLCQAPMVLTPLGDVAGVLTESAHYLSGDPVDQVNLALSVAGLGAVALTVASGGSTASIKLGASLAKLARRMSLLTSGLSELALRAVRDGIDWARLPAVRNAEDFGALLRPKVMAPLASVLSDTGRISAVVGPTETLHLLRYIDDAGDARRLADATEALGPKTVGRLEVLGKSRFFRATLRFSHRAIALVAALFGLLYAAGTLLAHVAGQAALRRLRRAARRV